MDGQCRGHAVLAVGRMVREAGRQTVDAEVGLPRKVLRRLVGQHRDEVAAAPGGAQRKGFGLAFEAFSCFWSFCFLKMGATGIRRDM